MVFLSVNTEKNETNGLEMNYLHRLFESSQFWILINCWYIEHKLERGMSTAKIK